jgi:cell division septum initiation protein DivIVA
MTISTIQLLVDRLERLVAESFAIPLTTNRIINEDDFFDVIDQMRTAIPEEIRQARRIQQERERMVAQAQEEANRVITLAREEADNLVQNSDIVSRAEARATVIREKARADTDQMRADADAYVRDVLSGLETELLRHLQTVRNGLQVLQPEAPELPFAEPPPAEPG